MSSNLNDILHNSGLKITPQRLKILESLIELKNHPTVETIKEHVHKNYPNIALGTIYNTLETFAEKGIVKKIKTEKDFVRYDVITECHHHIYCDKSERIDNYFDIELDNLLKEYFFKKPIEGWDIKEINLQISGTFKEKL